MINQLFKILFIGLLVMFLLPSENHVFAQSNTKSQTQTNLPDQVKVIKGKNPGQIKREKIFEEIQRYFGYETLPMRYLTLPYDVTMNSNVDAYYVEIGFLMLMFIPLILLIGYRKRPLIGFGVMLLTLLLFVISTANGILMKDKLIRTQVNEKTLTTDLSTPNTQNGMMDAVDHFIIGVYKVTHQLYMPFENFLQTFTGSEDHVTYPFLVFICFPLLFIILFVYLRYANNLRNIIIYAALLFAFLWLMFAAGIVWYGYLFMALSFIFMAAFFAKPFQGTARIIKYTFVGVIFAWFALTVVLRISNIYILDQSAGIHLFDAPIVKYQMGEKIKKNKRFSKNDLIQNYFPGLNTALKGINRNDDKFVYSIGTMFPYFVKKNNQRIFNDNLLALFQAILERYDNDKVTVAKVLKTSNFDYILINLKLHKIDKTPEKSVTQKFINFMQFAHQNPHVELIATDRLIKVNEKLSYGLIGDIQTEGSYAIFKLK